MSEVSASTRGISELLGRFVLGPELERRPSATVYRGTDKNLGNREVAIKIFNDSPNGNAEIIQSFEQEVATLRSASHPALVPIIAGGHDQGVLFLAMEMIIGKSLRDTLKDQNAPLDINASVNVAIELAEALKELHEQGMIHGHIDSRAVLFKGNDPRLAGYFPKAIDLILKQQTSGGKMIAEASYIAPEQVSGADIDARADIYALSVVLFEMVTGKRPFTASNPLQAAMLRLTQAPPSPISFNSEVTPLLEALILKGLAREPKNRFQTAHELIEALQAASGIEKNPFAALAADSGVPTSTLAVSMSADTIREMLKSQFGGGAAPAPAAASTPAAPAAASSPAPIMPADVTATAAVGMSTKQLLRPSLMMVKGKDRGKKFVIERQQAIIGGDPSCDIVVKDKGVPVRYAILVQRGEDYFVAPLAGSIIVNGTEFKGTDEIPLQRGDLIRAGSEELRFVAPGEVFTLKDDIAERVIDRPRSRAGIVLLAISTAVLVLAIGGFYLYQQQRSDYAARQKKTQLAKTRDREEMINKLKLEADDLLKKGMLREPTGNNAEEKFHQILELNPDDNYAKRRLTEITDRVRQLREDADRRQQLTGRMQQLLADGEAYFISKAYVSPPGRNAREAYQEALKIDPEHKVARERISEIDKLLSDMLGRVRERLAQAKALKEQGKYVEPPGDNAFEIIKEVLDVDPRNQEARELLFDMTARSAFRGDVAKARLQPNEARKSYLMAQALGADPAYVKARMDGLDLINMSRSGTVIVDRGKDKKDPPKSSGDSYLDSAEIERRVGVLEMQYELEKKGRRDGYIELKKK